jgi:hypothetical protein
MIKFSVHLKNLLHAYMKSCEFTHRQEILPKKILPLSISLRLSPSLFLSPAHPYSAARFSAPHLWGSLRNRDLCYKKAIRMILLWVQRVARAPFTASWAPVKCAAACFSSSFSPCTFTMHGQSAKSMSSAKSQSTCVCMYVNVLSLVYQACWL